MKELFLNEKGNYCFLFDGVEIENPVMSSDLRFSVNPEMYGFEIWPTGGGNTAHCQEFKLNDQNVIMALTDDNLCHVEPETILITGGLFDVEWENCFHNLEFRRD